MCANSIHFLLFPKADDVTSPSSSPPLWPIFSWAPQHLERLQTSLLSYHVGRVAWNEERQKPVCLSHGGRGQA